MRLLRLHPGTLQRGTDDFGKKTAAATYDPDKTKTET
jgi:hypothetical protein